jgi:hypothetical protein
MKTRILLFVAALTVAPGVSSAQTHVKCLASIDNFKIKTVYITGSQFNGVVWAYRHIAEETCLTPTLDPAKADAILEIVPNGSAPATDVQSDSLSVSCISQGTSSSCLDSDGNEMDIDCDGYGNCSSYFGPSPGLALLHALGDWARNAWYQAEARLYTPDHKLIWKSENQKSHFPDLWPDKLRNGTNSPPCKIPAAGSFARHKYKNYRNWGTIKCGIAFDPFASIDIKANARLAQKESGADQKAAETDEMKRNAQEAAAKQQTSQ